MKEQTHQVASLFADDAFDVAYSNYMREKEACEAAKLAVESAQAAQTAAIAALPPEQQADMARLEVIADQVGIKAAGAEYSARLASVGHALQQFVTTPAPTVFALSLKLESFKWPLAENLGHEPQYYIDRLIADAATLSMQLAHAWMDRWKALGGAFAYRYEEVDGEEVAVPMRSMLVDLDLWTPTDRDHPKLEPHAWLIEGRHHEGAVKVLEGFLYLVPGLSQTIRAIAPDVGVAA